MTKFLMQSLKTTGVAVALITPFTVFAAKEIMIKNGKGETIVSATLTQMAKGVKINLNLRNLPVGEHAVHFHDKAACKGPKFDSAGPHFSPTISQHGFDSDSGPHAGDMPNVVAAADGTIKAELINTAVTLGKGTNSLLKEGGTAIVIHEKADDYKSQPAGDAGTRLACGEVR